jgi:hypothetical protein
VRSSIHHWPFPYTQRVAAWKGTSRASSASSSLRATPSTPSGQSVSQGSQSATRFRKWTSHAWPTSHMNHRFRPRSSIHTHTHIRLGTGATTGASTRNPSCCRKLSTRSTSWRRRSSIHVRLGWTGGCGYNTIHVSIRVGGGGGGGGTSPHTNRPAPTPQSSGCRWSRTSGPSAASCPRRTPSS